MAIGVRLPPNDPSAFLEEPIPPLLSSPFDPNYFEVVVVAAVAALRKVVVIAVPLEE